MRHRQTFTFEELQETAHRLLKESDFTQEDMADELGVTRTSIGKAVTQPGPKFQRLQAKIIETLTGYEVEREEDVFFRVWRKDRMPEEK